MNPAGQDRSQEARSLVLEFLRDHAAPDPHQEELFYSRNPDLAFLLKELVPQLRGLTKAETQRHIEHVLAESSPEAGRCSAWRALATARARAKVLNTDRSARRPPARRASN